MTKLIVFASDPNAGNIYKISKHFNIEYTTVSADFKPENNVDYALITDQSNMSAAEKIPYLKAALIYNYKGNSYSIKSGTFQILTSRKDISNQLSGLSFCAPCKNANVFDIDHNYYQDLILLDGQSFFFLQNRNGCDWFYLGYSKVANLDQPVNEKYPSLDRIFPELIPFAMFFKYAFNIKYKSMACLMIDDPCLWKRYGLIDFKKAINLILKENFSITIAFIPWNHRRSHPATIRRFATNKDKISICVHGCDHTFGEFGSTDLKFLEWKTSLAKKRVEMLKARCGLSCDNIMVFPQGIFSKEAMKTLEINGFAAAVNTEILASNFSGGLSLFDLLTPAISFYGLPLFLRRRPTRIEDFAYDLFFGRPALIVQHNADFMHGWKKTITFIRLLNAVDTELNWMPIGEIVASLCSYKPLVYEQGLSSSQRYTPMAYIKILTRRLLCEFRDHVMQRNRLLRALIKVR